MCGRDARKDHMRAFHLRNVRGGSRTGAGTEPDDVQLRLLRAAEIVSQRRDGKIVYYSLKNRKIEDVMFAGVKFLGL